MTKKPRDRWRAWIVDRVPLALLTHAHEAFLAVAVFIIGGGLVMGDVRPGSVASQVPEWINMTWAWFLFSGSVSTLWGLFQDRPRAEWAGQMLLGWSCFFYSGAIYGGVGLRSGGVVFAVFLGLALVSWWRAFKITSVAYVQRRLAMAAREAARKVREKGEGSR